MKPYEHYIADFLLSELEIVISKEFPYLKKYIIEFEDIAKNDPEIFFEKFTNDPENYKFDHFTDICQYYSVREILISLADEIMFIKTNQNENSLIKAVQQIRCYDFTSTLNNFRENFSSSPVFTSHPTEFFSDGAIKITDDIKKLFTSSQSSEKINKEIFRYKLASILKCHLTPKRKLTVKEEVERNLKYFEKVYNFIPKLKSDLVEAFRVNFANIDPATIHREIVLILQNSIKFRSWAGGDSDGNFHITFDTMEVAVKMHQNKAADLHLKYFRKHFAHRNSIIPIELQRSLELLLRQSKIDSVIEKLSQLVSLNEDIETFILLLKIFGEHVAKIDARQNMYLLSQVVGQVLASVTEHLAKGNDNSSTDLEALKLLEKFNYLSLIPDGQSDKNCSTQCEETRFEVLDKVIKNNRIIEVASKLFKTGKLKSKYKTAHQELSKISMMSLHPEIFANYIVSNTEEPSSLFQLNFLALICSSKFNIIPLFETRSALEKSCFIIKRLMSNASYTNFLAGRSQKIMIGYSDSQKENGICILPVIDNVIQELKTLSKKLQIPFEFFHGNGLDIGRGGPSIIEPEQTFQGRHIRYAFCDYENARNYYTNLIMKSKSRHKNHSNSLAKDFLNGCNEFKKITKDKILLKNLDSYLAVATPFQIFVKPNNFSSRATKKTNDDPSLSPFGKWFKKEIYKDPEVLAGIRAIPWVNTVEGSNTFFNLWLGVIEGLINVSKQNPQKDIILRDDITNSIIKKALIGHLMSDMAVAWRFINKNKELKNITRQQAINFLTFIEGKYAELNSFINVNSLSLDEDLTHYLAYRKRESIYIRSAIAWLNRKIIFEQKNIKSIFKNPNQKKFKKFVGALYLAFSEYRRMPKGYDNQLS